MPSDKDEIRAKKKKRPKTPFVIAKAGVQQCWLGFYDGAIKKGKTHSAALLVALVRPNAIVFFPVDAEHAWVCAIADGMPVVEHDLLLPIAEARSKAVELSSTFVNAVMIGELSGAQITLAQAFEILDEQIKAKLVKSDQVATALLKSDSISASHIVLMLVVLSIPAAAWYGAKTYKRIRLTQLEQDSTLAEAARQTLIARQSQAKREQQIAEFRDVVDAKRKEYAVRVHPYGFWSEFTNIRQALPVSQFGYKPESVQCTDAQCQVTWRGAGRFTTPADKLRLPNVAQSLTTELVAVSTFPIEATLEATPIAAVKTPDELRFLFFSAVSGRIAGFQIDPMQAITVSPPKDSGLSAETVAHVGKWRVKVQSRTALIQAADIVKTLSPWPVRVNSIKYGPAQSGFDIDGEYILLIENRG